MTANGTAVVPIHYFLLYFIVLYSKVIGVPSGISRRRIDAYRGNLQDIFLPEFTNVADTE